MNKMEQEEKRIKRQRLWRSHPATALDNSLLSDNKGTEGTVKMVADQGSYEMEILSGAESTLQELESHCQKNPEHKGFHSVQEFKKEHLPSGYQDDLILNLIRAIADLTLCLIMKYTSSNRPDSYPCSNMRGKKCFRFGSGWVDNVGITFKSQDKKTCPCLECKTSLTPATDWGEVFIYTAKHVLYDTEEALNTMCDLFYDSDNDDDEADAILMGIEMLSGNIKEDVCSVKCVTHNLPLLDKLESMCRLRDKLQEEVGDKYGKQRDEHKLVVIVSHPHGRSKQVSVGEWTDKHVEVLEDDEIGNLTHYEYNASTCPGCSGAPVYILGQLLAYSNHAHSGKGEQDSINVSGLQWEDTNISLSSHGSNSSLHEL